MVTANCISSSGRGRPNRFKLDHLFGQSSLDDAIRRGTATQTATLAGPAGNIYAAGMVRLAKDGRTWQIGTDVEVAWIANGTSIGRTITAAIPPVVKGSGEDSSTG